MPRFACRAKWGVCAQGPSGMYADRGERGPRGLRGAREAHSDMHLDMHLEMHASVHEHAHVLVTVSSGHVP